MQEQSDQRIKVRKVTDIHANWSAQGVGEPGKFSFQLVLDNGAEEFLLRPEVSDMKPLIKLLRDSDSVHVDTEREIVIFNEVGSDSPTLG